MGVVAPVLIILFVFGAVIGSFLNVVIHRLPRAEGWRAQLGSLVSPGSHCPGCERPIAWYDNIPLVSYALLRGRCRRCGESIPIRYPLVEFANASLYLLAGLVLGLGPELYPALLFISTLIAVFFIDLEHYIIPNVIVLPVAAVGLVSMIAIEPGRWLELLLAGVISAAFFLLIAFVKPGGMGMGDVKLAGMMGFYLGTSILVALFIGFLTGALAGLALMAMGRKGRKSRVPFGPFLALGGIIALLAGSRLLDLYLGIFNQGV
jgi:leader peptidase (prepilin peptidase)/N-methyltransferase